MALSDFVIETSVVKFPKGSMTVRGLTFADISNLLTNAESDMAEAVELFQNGDTNDAEHQQAFLAVLLAKLPVLCARGIAIAADEPEAWQNARKLPIPVQAEALTEIARLTFTEPDSLKKFIAHARTAFNKMAELKS